VLTVIKSRNKRRGGHLIRIEGMKNAGKIYSRKLEESGILGEADADGRII
jgi:hypothetical protein